MGGYSSFIDFFGGHRNDPTLAKAIRKVSNRVNQGWIYQDRISQAYEGWTVLNYYSQKYAHSTQEEWAQKLVDGQIFLNRLLAQAETKLVCGDRLTYHRPPWEEPEVPLDFETLYADQDLLVIVKPSGMPVQPGGGFLEHTLLGQLHRLFPEATPVPVHRLGRGTSGLMLLAISSKAKADLSRQLRKRLIQKVYRTLVDGNTMPDQFTIEQPIGKIDHPKLGYLFAATPDGLVSRSDCLVLRRNLETSLLEVNIHSGRPHQIRIHLAAAGYPLFEDPLYGIGGVPKNDDSVPGDLGYHLHATTLGFHHPSTQRWQEFTSTPPRQLI
jgi:23S rRNA pseudouridine1911/1915/1917 synthase